MTQPDLYILVEGDDDKRFFESQRIKGYFERRYNTIHVVKYREIRLDRLERFFEGIRAMEAEYIFVHDLDKASCFPRAIIEVRREYKSLALNPERILIVIREIEGWYLAGASGEFCDKHDVPNLASTEDVTKRQFEDLIEGKFLSRVIAMVEMLRSFSLELATVKNGSIAHFRRSFC